MATPSHACPDATAGGASPAIAEPGAMTEAASAIAAMPRDLTMVSSSTATKAAWRVPLSRYAPRGAQSLVIKLVIESRSPSVLVSVRADAYAFFEGRNLQQPASEANPW